MEPQSKRMLLATFLCLGVLVGWMKLMQALYPPPEPPALTAPSTTAPAALADAEQPATTAATEPSSAPAPSTRSAAEMRSAEPYAPDAPSTATLTIGDERENNARTGFVNPFEMGVTVTPRGAAVESLKLSRHRSHPPADPNNPTDDPYPLLHQVIDPDTEEAYNSFATESVRLIEDKVTVPLDGVIWSLRKETDAESETAVLQTVVKSDPGAGASDLLEITKTYRLERGASRLLIALGVRNLSDQQRSILVTERGPIGLPAEDPRSEYRHLVFAVVNEETGSISSGATLTRDTVLKAEDARHELLPGEGRGRLWAAVCNKYFACIVDPRPRQKEAKFADYVGQVFGRAPLRRQSKADDLTVEWLLKPKDALAPKGQPGDAVTLEFSTYCGAQGERALAALPPDLQNRGYEIVSHVNVPGCTFSFLTTAMQWLLTRSYGLVHNYGIAIFILVIVVRLILHPISKRTQMNMVKMQKGMAKLKPKMEAIQQQYKNDKQKLSEETMKLYREEGVNPASNVLGCLPMLLQMPILVALYSALNLDVELRHQPFCLWIRDLSSPDALVQFNWSYHIPLIGAMMGPITAFNLLPLVMIVSMYAQQKFMQKLTQANTPRPVQKDKDGNVIPDQMAQQQKMMTYMMIPFGLMFYNLPSGLNLYFLTSNLLGVLEQYIIKKELRRREEAGEFEIKKKPADAPKKPSLIGRYLEMAQKSAEQARRVQSDRPGDAADKKRSKTRP